MSNRTRTLFLGLTLALTAPFGVSIGAQEGKPLRVLFVGNSYIYFNDLPSLIGDLSTAAHESRPFLAEQVLIGAATLERHLALGDAMTAIRRGGWDVVVLQEQSTRPINNPALMLRDARTLADAVKKIGAKLVWYETWAKELDPSTQDSLTHGYHRAAAATGGKIAHVGEAWAAFRAAETVPAGTHSALFVADGSHPSEAGTYLAASVFYATLYGKSPVGLPATSRTTHEQPAHGPPAGAPKVEISKELAARLQALAWATTTNAAGANDR